MKIRILVVIIIPFVFAFHALGTYAQPAVPSTFKGTYTMTMYGRFQNLSYYGGLAILSFDGNGNVTGNVGFGGAPTPTSGTYQINSDGTVSLKLNPYVIGPYIVPFTPIDFNLTETMAISRASARLNRFASSCDAGLAIGTVTLFRIFQATIPSRFMGV